MFYGIEQVERVEQVHELVHSMDGPALFLYSSSSSRPSFLWRVLLNVPRFFATRES